MKITNNVFEFEASDVEQLSPDVQKALQSYIGERITIEERLSAVCNELVTEASKLIVVNLKDKIDKLTDIQRADIEARLKAYVPDEVVVDPKEKDNDKP